MNKFITTAKWQPNPEAQASLRIVPRPAWQQVREQMRRLLQALGDDQPTLAPDLVVLGQQPTGNHLRRERSAQVCDRPESAELRHKRLGCPNPADPQAGPEELAE